MSVIQVAFVVLLLGLADARSAKGAHLRPKRQAMSKPQILTGLTNVVKSPDYPKNYPNNVDQTYIIVFPDPQAYYKVTFHVNAFQIENAASCIWDYLKISNGTKFCGYRAPGDTFVLDKVQGSVEGTFHSDYSVTGRGFSISYSLEKLVVHITPMELTGGVISPNYPNNYPNNVDQDYTIKFPDPEAKYKVIFLVNDFSIEGGTSCPWDYLEITNSSIPKFCGDIPPGSNFTLDEVQGSVEGKFHSDSSVTGRGFNISYSLEKLGVSTDKFSQNGTSSNTTDACMSNPCQNGGTCYDMGDSYICYCSMGYEGSNCVISTNNSSGNGTSSNTTDACLSNPCQNGGTCYNMGDSYICYCSMGYEGFNCGISTDNSSGNGTSSNTIDECLSNPCQNGGICIDMVNSYSCYCYMGYGGSNCEISINSSGNGTSSNTTDACLSNPCQNGGICNDMGDSYTCFCSMGYEGFNCGISSNNSSGNGTSSNTTDACLSNPCQNGGTCNDMGDSYICYCSMGYEGFNCGNGNATLF